MGSYAQGGLYSERVFPWIMDRADTSEVREERRRAVSGARGRVLEIGVGTGLNFRLYGPAARSVTAIEPSGGMNRRAARNRMRAHVPVRLVAGSAERLPFRDGAFDTVVAVFVLWNVLNGMGTFALINEWVVKLFAQDSEVDIMQFFERNKVMSAAILVSVVNVVLLTALATIGAFLYNVVSSVVGGVYVTLTDD